MNFYSLIYKIFSHPVHWLYRIRAVGTENIPKEGCILASNHTAISDVLVISAAAKRQVRYMAKQELFKIPLLAQLIKALGAYPVNRGGSDVSSIRRTIKMLAEGEMIGIFPQGHRFGRVDPRTTPVKGGVGMIAYHAKTLVLPVFVDTKGGKTGMFRKNTVMFGKPIPYDRLGFVNGGIREYQSASEKIFAQVCALKYGEALPPEAAVTADAPTETAEKQTSEERP